MNGTVGAVLCDLDGVLRLWEPMAELDLAHGLPSGTLAKAAFREERLLPAITGLLSDEQWRAAVADDLASVCGSASRARELVAAWSLLTGRVDQEVADLLSAVRHKGVRVVLVSNATTRLEADLERLGLDRVLDAVVNTSRVGVAKPDARVYPIASERAGVPMSRCLFVDDSQANVAAAEAAGMRAVLYRRPADLRAALGMVSPR